LWAVSTPTHSTIAKNLHKHFTEPQLPNYPTLHQHQQQFQLLQNPQYHQHLQQLKKQLKVKKKKKPTHHYKDSGQILTMFNNKTPPKL